MRIIAKKRQLSIDRCRLFLQLFAEYVEYARFPATADIMHHKNYFCQAGQLPTSGAIACVQAEGKTQLFLQHRAGAGLFFFLLPGEAL